MSGLRYGDRAIRRERDPENPGPPLQQPTVDKRDFPRRTPDAPPPSALPFMDFNDLRTKVTQANVLYGQLQAERMEAERMENDALIALKEAQAAFDRHIQEFRGSFPDSSLWGR